MSTNTSEKVFITTPIYYVNAKPHLGHAYGTILADFLSKYHSMRGRDVFFLTGTDEHGEKIANKAREEGITPQEFTDRIVENFRGAWEALGLTPNKFYRTSQKSHHELVRNSLQRLKDKDEIYFAEYEGKYCVGCERFRTDSEWNEEGLCPDHLTPPEIRKEPNYFFRMSGYQERLIKYYEDNPESIQPKQYLNEVMGMLREPLEDLNISRPKTRLTWGIELPFDDKYVTYVWFDALLNYLGGIGYNGKVQKENPEFHSELWEKSYHTIGKDIVKTHAIYWPTMLMALDLPVFHRLLVNGYWQVKGQKMSKSLGNVIDPLVINKNFGADPFRYFLLREMSYGADASFSVEAFVQRCNAELANGIGNLASRTLTLVKKNFDLKVPAAEYGEKEKALFEKLNALPQQIEDYIESNRFHLALRSFAEAVADCDGYINDTKPWALAKEGNLKELAVVLRCGINALSLLSLVSYPFMPNASVNLREALGLNTENLKWEDWSKLPEDGAQLGEVPRLFPRMEIPKDLE